MQYAVAPTMYRLHVAILAWRRLELKRDQDDKLLRYPRLAPGEIDAMNGVGGRLKTAMPDDMHPYGKACYTNKEEGLYSCKDAAASPLVTHEGCGSLPPLLRRREGLPFFLMLSLASRAIQ